MTVTVDVLTDPLGTAADASGTNGLASTVAVLFVDHAGGTVGPVAASIVGTTWHVDAVNVSALADGVVVAQVTETPTAGPLKFAARAATKRTLLSRHITGEPWATHLDVRPAYTASDADVDLACWIASDILFLLTGSRWPGSCPDVVRPQARWRAYDRPGWWQSLNGRGSRYGWCSCNRGKEFGCSAIPEIELPHGPVDPASVTVKIDGVPFTDWTILDRQWLARTDGDGWTCCQATQLPDTQPNTWSVAYSWGSLPDAGGTLAAASLGYQLSLAFRADSKCALPRRIQTITRGGTSMTLLDPMTIIAEGATGLSEVDLWIAAHMIGNKRRPGTISSVGKQPRFRRDATA